MAPPYFTNYRLTKVSPGVGPAWGAGETRRVTAQEAARLDRVRGFGPARVTVSTKTKLNGLKVDDVKVWAQSYGIAVTEESTKSELVGLILAAQDELAAQLAGIQEASEVDTPSEVEAEDEPVDEEPIEDEE